MTQVGVKAEEVKAEALPRALLDAGGRQAARLGQQEQGTKLRLPDFDSRANKWGRCRVWGARWRRIDLEKGWESLNERAQEQDVAGPSERRCEGMNWEESEGPALRYGAGHGGDRDTTDR